MVYREEVKFLSGAVCLFAKKVDEILSNGWTKKWREV